jgi:predicted XRE-type DNA-binding protein
MKTQITEKEQLSASIAIEMGSINPYADLSYAESSEILIKAKLAFEISSIIKNRKLTQQTAATLLGMTQPKLSEMLRGKFRGIGQAKMIDCLNRLGSDVEIIVKRPNSHRIGQTQVLTT